MNRKSLHCLRRKQLINTLRKLWMELAFWTRAYIISASANLDDLTFVTDRMLRIPSDFADELSLFYGNEAAARFQSLLTDHLSMAAQLIDDAKTGNSKSADPDRSNWYRNADDISGFLASLNPCWKASTWQPLLYDYLQTIESEGAYRLGAQYSSDIIEFDRMEEQALEIADYMIEGIRRQYCL